MCDSSWMFINFVLYSGNIAVIAVIPVITVLCGSGGVIMALVVTVMCASKSLAYHNS